MTTQDLEDRNNQTWGWQGCGNLFVGMNICLSTGVPPFPANVPNSVCGPQVNNTQPTSDPSTWADLNPCPLKACCDVFGQCGKRRCLKLDLFMLMASQELVPTSAHLIQRKSSLDLIEIIALC